MKLSNLQTGAGANASPYNFGVTDMLTHEQQMNASDGLADDVLELANEYLLTAQQHGANDSQVAEINLNGLGEALARAVASTAFHTSTPLAPLVEKVFTLLNQRGAYWYGQLQGSDLQPGEPLGLDHDR